MIFPEKLKKGDTIGICAPSEGIIEPEKIEKLDKAIKQLKNLGYKVIETKSVRNSNMGKSNIANERAKEFMELWENNEVKLILYASGGDFLMEILDKLDFDKLRNSKPKWTQGFSDITHLSFLLNILCDIPSIYCEHIKEYAMQPLFRNLTDSFKLISGENVIQYSFEKYVDVNDDKNEDYTYKLTKNTYWQNITGQNEISIKGRAIGGCLDCVDTIIGTKFDKVEEYINKYKKDGIIWFLECYEMNTPQLQRILWKMKHAGYFNNCTGIIFGRSNIMREDYELTFAQAILNEIGELNIPIITEADIGHVPPQFAIMQGSILKIVSKDGKGRVETILN